MSEDFDSFMKNHNEFMKIYERIEELENHIKSMVETGTNHNDSIIELRSLIQSNAISDLNHYEANEREIASLRERQREAIGNQLKFNQWCQDKLLAKLDVRSARQTEKPTKYYVDRYDEYWKKMCNQPLIPVEFGNKTFKREPREDDVKLSPICGKFLDGDKEWNDYAYSLIPVKRENLLKPYKDFIKDIEYWQNTNREGISTMYILSDLKSKYARRLGKIKEEYSL